MQINDPRFNLREATKQLILLEQHLLEKGKYCPDCISKHILCIEALAEEGECLDETSQLCKNFRTLSRAAKRWASMFVAGHAPQEIGQEVRRVRKALAQHVLDPEGASSSTELAGMGPESFGVTNAGTWLVLFGLVGAAAYWAESRNQKRRLLA